MDLTEECDSSIIAQKLSPGDEYLVHSDSGSAHSSATVRPETCQLQFRGMEETKITFQLMKWTCESEVEKPFLAIYDYCEEDLRTLVVL